MTTVTGLTAERMLEIEADSVVDGDVVGGNLILTKHDGSQINAGSVVGPEGPVGPVGSDLAVIAAKPVLDIGVIDQIRAGRQLTPTDFANIGLNAPLGLWNLSDLTDVSGNGRNLLNKGAVTFGKGINGLTPTAAIFTGSTAQALYIADTGAADPFRIRTGSLGCWFKTGRSGLDQTLISKRAVSAPNLGYHLYINGADNSLSFYSSSTGSDWAGGVISGTGGGDGDDDRWHFGVVTYDGNTLKVYFDGAVGIDTYNDSLIFGVAQPLNIGGYGADGSVAAATPFYGRIDEAFITNDILSAEQIKYLYSAKIPHSLAAVPSKVTVNVHRRRKGSAFVTGDFPSQPVRLYNFSAGSLGDAGSNNVTLTAVGTPVSIPGVDGISGNAFNFLGTQCFRSTDTGLPAGVTAMSCGCWVKALSQGAGPYYMLTWGSAAGTSDFRMYIANGLLRFSTGADDVAYSTGIADGLWHFVVVVHNNTAVDGVKRKLYVDGKLVAASTVMTSIVLGGANQFGVAGDLAGTRTLQGQMDQVFVCNVALTSDEILKLYAKSAVEMSLSPRDPDSHIEAMSSTDLLGIFDLESSDQVDIKVTA